MSQPGSEPAQPVSILAMVHSFDPGGVERVALRLCEAWRCEEADVTVLVGRRTGAMRDLAPNLSYVSYSSGRLSTAPFETLWMILCLWRRIRAVRPDVIFCPGSTYTIVAVCVRLLLGKRCPPVVAKISNALERGEMSPAVRFAYRQWLAVQGRSIDVFVAMAPSLRKEIVESMKADPGRVAVIDDPALGADDADRLAGRGAEGRDRAGNGRLFLSAGRLVAQKRFDRLLRAFAAGTSPCDRLVILGEGPLRRRLEKLALRLGVSERVDMPGHAADLGEWLRRADCFVLASDYEGVPAVVVEAVAAGVPVVATDSSPAIADLLGHGCHGRIVQRMDEAALARALALVDRSQVDAEAGLRHAMRFHLDRSAPVYLRLLTALAQSRRESQGPRIRPAPAAVAPCLSLSAVDGG